MSGVATHIRLETVIRLCELYGHDREMVEKTFS